MTPLEVCTQARNKYNAIGDTFWSDAELYHLQYEGCMELAVECKAIESTATQSTVASQQAYDFPTRCHEIKRITYAGAKLKPITMREDDAITLLNSATTATGTPQYYFIWDDSIYLRPIPSGVGTLKVWSWNIPATIDVNSTLEIPTWSHPGLVNFLLREMCAKDENDGLASYYGGLWERTKAQMARWAQKRKRGDAFNGVQDEESLAETVLGSL